MGDSNGTWGELAAHDSELAEVWDGYDRLPDPGELDALDAFCERKRITIPALVRLGAKLADSTVLAFGFDHGIKYRDLVTDRRWSYIDSEWRQMKLVRHGDTPTGQIIVVEGETDGARLTEGYDVDVAIMPAGAKYFPQAYADQLADYDTVLVGLDDDQAGNDGAAKIAELVASAVRFTPPVNDWCEATELPPLPEAAPERLEILVSAGTLVDFEPPAITSWFEQATLPVAGFMMLHGWVKSYKSFAAFDMLASLAQGQPWAHLEPTEEPCRVAVIQYEIPWPYYQQRVQQLRYHATDTELFDENFLTWDPLRRPQLVAGNTKQEDHVISTLVESNIQVALIDPVRRLAGTANLNAEDEVRRSLGFFERLQDEGITVVATHHDNKSYAGKGDPLGMTGAGSFAGDPDTIVSIELPKGDDYRTSTRRNIRFVLRNAPAIGGRGLTMTDEGRIEYSTTAYNDDEADDPDAPAI